MYYDISSVGHDQPVEITFDHTFYEHNIEVRFFKEPDYTTHYQWSIFDTNLINLKLISGACQQAFSLNNEF